MGGQGRGGGGGGGARYIDWKMFQLCKLRKDGSEDVWRE